MLDKDDISFQIQIAISQVYQLRDYYSRMEQIFESTKDWQLLAIKKRASELPEHRRKSFLDRNFPYTWDLSFPSELRASIIISCVSLLESQLIRFCHLMASRNGADFIEPKRNRFVMCRTYLAKYGLRGPERTDWRTFEYVCKVRNILVHNGASLDGSGKDEEINKLRKLLQGIGSDETGYYIKRELCEIVLSSGELILCAIDRNYNEMLGS